MNTPSSNLQVLDIDHLGIVAGIIDEIAIVETVNDLLGEHPQGQVSLGQVLKATRLPWGVPISIRVHFVSQESMRQG
jgi:hypothetical protein